MPYLGTVTAEEFAAQSPHHPFFRRYTRDEVVAEWQSMVLGGKHGAHKNWCSMCRGLNIPALIFIQW